MKRLIRKFVSGGQSGVDRAALDLAIELKIPHGGWCPKGRLAEDGIIPSKYSLVETPLEDVNQRTEWNARDSDGTLILSMGPPQAGTLWTLECAKRHSKPCLLFELESEPSEVDVSAFEEWLTKNRIEVLNIAGPRESHAPGKIYSLTRIWLTKLLN